MSEQMSLDSILNSDDAPATKEEAPEKPQATEAPAKTEAKPEAPEQPERIREPSGRQKLREKDALADGKVRDPVTGQFVKQTDAPAQDKTEQPDKKVDAAGAAPADAKPDKPAAAATPAVPAAPAQPEFTDKEKAFLRAAQEERAKRQELERQIAALRQPAATEPPKSAWDDLDGTLKAQEERFQNAVATVRIQTAETIARSRYQDFDEKVAAFGQIAQGNPWIANQVMQSADPAEAAYRIGKNALELQQIGGMDAMRAKIEQETEAKTRAKIEAELKAKAELAAKERAELPGSLSQARSTGGPNKPVWNGPPSLDEILKVDR